jgi:hypothetical protein
VLGLRIPIAVTSFPLARRSLLAVSDEHNAPHYLVQLAVLLRYHSVLRHQIGFNWIITPCVLVGISEEPAASVFTAVDAVYFSNMRLPPTRTQGFIT